MSRRKVGMEMKDDGDRIRLTKLEEALEIQSIRRIISAYLNYPDATEKDVKRYERSYSKLPPSHKALLSHFPSKFERLRRCISVNSVFIFNMLQAFEPPLDMSQDINTCDHPHLENANDHLFSGESKISSCLSASTSERMCVSKSDQACNGEGSYKMCKLSKGVTDNEEDVRSGDLCGPILRSCPTVTEIEKDTDKAGFHDLKRVNNQATPNSASITNKNFTQVSSSTRDWLDASLQLEVPFVDVDKVRCTLKNIVRDWTIEGQKERDQCFKPILEELDSLFPNRQEESPPACLVPGAGLGRLAWEISCLGFVSQGNEFSYYMMICSSFILNESQTAGEWTIYPWIHSNCNSLSDSDQLRPVSFPDIHPASFNVSSGGRTTEGFSMCGGDFVEVYSDPSQVGFWDAVVTCFFIDTAHNIVEYIEIISKILKDGGVWINLGPLLYHFADMYEQEDEMSIEPSLEDVKKIAFNFGFQLEKEMTIETTYSINPRSMMQNRYYSAFWTMRKKPVTPTKKHATP